MILWDILYAFFLGLIFTAIFTVGFGRERGWGSIFASLFLIFLAVWAGGKWTSQLFLYTHGVYGLPVLIIGLIIILILTALIPSQLEKHETDTAPAAGETNVKRSFHHYRFWTVAVFFIVSIVSWYILFSQNGPSSNENLKYYNGPDTLKNWKHPDSKK
jgi:ABC-type uncharacterized transport system permease subunit